MNTHNFCNNCGTKGHIFYQCKQPITSVGIIVFRKNEQNLNEYLMIPCFGSLEECISQNIKFKKIYLFYVIEYVYIIKPFYIFVNLFLTKIMNTFN